MHSVGSPLWWALFSALIAMVLAVDLGLFNRKARELSTREAAAWTAVWMALALGFNVFVYAEFGPIKAAEFFQAWIVEQTLSVDNIFVFLVIFAFFAVPSAYQHRLLFWGILGAIFARGGFIFLGSALVARFQWVMYIFGAILIYTSIKLLRQGDDEEINLENNLFLRAFRRVVPTVPDYRGAAFVVREGGRLMATPLLAVLVVLVPTDLVFAVDSIPAVFGVTDDVFIIYTSNIFAVMGLRSMAFVVAGALQRMHYLKYGLALILGFIGAKILIAELYHVPSTWSLVVVVLSLLGAGLASVLFPPQDAEGQP